MSVPAHAGNGLLTVKLERPRLQFGHGIVASEVAFLFAKNNIQRMLRAA
jgi:hypothetical protein